MDYGELYDALMRVKKACDEIQHVSGCEHCPMSADNGDVCCVATTPDNWYVIPPEVKLMR